jgi:hypothetical protein
MDSAELSHDGHFAAERAFNSIEWILVDVPCDVVCVRPWLSIPSNGFLGCGSDWAIEGLGASTFNSIEWILLVDVLAHVL